MMSHAHNGYLDVLLTLGAAGLVLYLVWLLACARTFHRALSRQFEFAALWRLPSRDGLDLQLHRVRARESVGAE